MRRLAWSGSSVVGRAWAIVIVATLGSLPARARAQAGPGEATLKPDTQVEFSTEAESTAKPAAPDGDGTAATPTNGEPSGPELANASTEGAPGEAPPPFRPAHHGVVLETTAGVLGFGGQFRHLAPPAYWMHGQLGYEVFSWLMLFGEAELALTSTSEEQDPSHARAFPLWGFGGGARVGWRSRSWGAFVQGEVGGLSAVVPHDALAYLGFHSAESLGLQFGGRAGLEWYHRDRHIALTLQGGARVAQGFARFQLPGASSDLGLMWDSAVGLRYTF